MRVDRTTDTMWLTRAPKVAVAPRGAQGAAWLRAAGIAAAAAALAAVAVSAGAPVGTVADASTAAERAERKEAARLPRWKGQDAAAGAPAAPAPAEPRAFEVLDPRPAGAEGRFAAADADLAQPAAFAPRPAFAADAWRHGSFEVTAVLDGRTFAAAGGLRVRLGDLEAPGADEACRTLDGRLESCAARAATQLELLTRSRTLSCRYRADGGADEVVGECRLGGGDLAERLLRTGYFRRPSAAPRAAEAPGVVGRS